MTTLDELHDQLRVAASLLDGSAGMIRDCPLQPTSDHIRRIGEALSQVFDIQRAIYELRPDLQPLHLRDNPKEFAEANRRLTVAAAKAYRCAEAGQIGEANRILTEYIAAETSDRHKAIAQGILARWSEQ